MKDKTLIDCKIEFIDYRSTITAIYYDHNKKEFIKIFDKISAELVQDLHHRSIDISMLDFSIYKQTTEPTESELEDIYNKLLNKKNSGSSLRYKVSKLDDFEIKAFELLSEKLVSYFRNQKLNLIGI